MTILVTGGAGFIGSNFINYMIDKYPDYRIICVDALTYAGNILYLNKALPKPNFAFVRMDITDKTNLTQLFVHEHPDIVINFAAETHVDNSINEPQIFIDTNIKGTASLLDICKKFEVKRFHQVSTDEVYGDLPLDRPDLLFTEDTPINPSSPYSASKAAADMLVMAYHRTYGLPVTISRCSNNYGPNQNIEKLIPRMIYNALHNELLTVYGNGLNVRDWLYVDDHCRAIDNIIHNGKDGEIYNVGGNNEKSNIEIVNIIKSLIKDTKSKIKYVEDRKGHDLRYAIDYTKIKNELGWEPEVKFEDGIKDTVEWYINNINWLKKLP